MKRIGRFLYAISTLVALLGLISSKASCQSVSVSATVSETTIFTGEIVELSVEVTGDFSNVSRPELPQFENLRLLSSTPSVGREYSFSNGRSSVTFSYTYNLIAQNTGSHKIPAISISVDGKEYQTEPIEISIVDRNESAQSDEPDRPNIFLRLEVSDSKPVTGQQIITDVVLFFKDGLEVNSYQPVPGWKAEGFWKEELENARRPQATSTIINGVRYRKARLLQFALFPTKSGELEISPYEIIVSVRSARSGDDPFSSFFGGFGNNRRSVELESDPITVDVQSLPPTNGSEYLGAVGYFNISRTINTQNAVVGESVEITTRIQGNGNIPLISKPDYQLPSGLEVYDPQETSSINRRNQQISGSKTFTDIIIARSPGRYTIPQKQVAYFNPSQNNYVTETLPALNFEVNENPDAVTTNSTPTSSPVKPITGLATWITPSSTNLTTNWWFWTGLILPLIILGISYWQKSYMEKMNTDQAFARSQLAADKASDRLQKAIELSEQGHIKEAYNMLQKALTGFISDRLTLAEAGLSNKDYVEAIRQHGVDDNLVKNVRMLLDKCASVSYAPDTTHEYLKSHVGLAQSTLEKLKKEL
jgi:hypothetical protein